MSVPAARRAGWLRQPRFWLLLAAALLLLGSTGLALQQSPHPDAFRPPPGWLEAGFWRWPIERNAFQRLPLTASATQALHVSADGAVWMLTAAGEILHRSADGRHWQLQWPKAMPKPAAGTAAAMIPGLPVAHAQVQVQVPAREGPPPAGTPGKAGAAPNQAAPQSPPAAVYAKPEPPAPQSPATSSEASRPAAPELHGLHFLADARHGWVVGDAGTLLATDDGGDHWQRIELAGFGEPALRSVWFVDAQTGWIVGDDGLRLRTHDGGRSWQPPDPSRALPPPALHAVRFVDRERGWAAGEQGALLASVDGGASWRTLASGTQARLTAIDVAADGATVRVVGAAGTLLQLDAADGYTPRPTPIGGLDAFDVRFAADGRHGWIAAGDGWLLATADGGAHWQRQRIDDDDLTALALSAEGRQLWIGSRGGVLQQRADDGYGARFVVLARGGERQARRLTAVHDGRLFLLGPPGRSLVADAAGERWTPLATGSAHALLDVCLAADGLRGWLVGASGNLFETDDGGRSWQPSASGARQDLRAIDCSADGRRIVAVGRNGTVLASTDGGVHWQVQTPDTSDLVAVRLAAEPLQATATGADGQTLTTVDGGRSWTLADRGRYDLLLHTVRTGADGRRWAIDLGGRLWRTADSGWQTVGGLPAGTPALYDVEVLADGRRVFAVGADGTLLRSVDGGASWQALAAATGRLLYGVRFGTDGRHGRIAGEGPILLATDDGGETWRGGERSADLAWRDWPVYARWPAPWLYPVWGLGLGCLWLAARKPRAEYAAAASIGDAPASDKPLEPGDADALAFGPLARGLANFLRNEHTHPPLTVAITGNWGTGKSSLMNLLRAELARYGVCAVWFNAWHHQKEEQLLAALVDGIRRQAIPSPLGFDGLRFRARLLWLRCGRHWPWALLFVLLACWSGAYFLQDFPLRFERALAIAQQIVAGIRADAPAPGSAQPLPGGADSVGAASGQSPTTGAGPAPAAVPAAAGQGAGAGDAAAVNRPGAASTPPAGPSVRPAAFAQGLAALVAALTALIAALKAVRAFGVKPEALLASLATKTRVSDLGAQTSFRYRYRQEFAEVTQALAPRTMLILIDDLDRCQPAQVLEMLEVVNFLVSAGDCFIVLGIDKEKVQGALGLAFRELAQEMVDQGSDAADTRSDEVRARDKRQRYARDYLEKLINIEVPVPLLDGADPVRGRGMLAGASAGRERAERRLRCWRERLNDGLRALAGLLLFAAAALGGLYLAGLTPVLPPAATLAPAATAPAGSAGTAGADGRPASTGTSAPRPASRGAASVIGPQAGAAWPPLVALPVLALLFGALVFVLRRPDIVVRDSPRFGEALDIWYPYLLRHHRPTPRTLKRYQNRIRYVAMRQRPADARPDPLERLLRRWLRLPLEPDEAEDAALPEPLLVALGALQLVDRQFLEAEPGRFTSVDPPSEPGSAQTAAQDQARIEAIRLHLQHFGESGWPPSRDDIRRFLRLSEGVTLR